MEELKKHWLKVLLLVLTAGVLWGSVQYTVASHDREIDVNRLNIINVRAHQQDLQVTNAQILVELRHLNESVRELKDAVKDLHK